MRPVNKGTAPKVYTNYGDARHDLAERIGYYCSYCEMGVHNMIEVEHKLPIDQGGNRLDWNNFLLSCKYCNTIKKARNTNLTDHFWADRDNTDLVFDYDEVNVIIPKNTLDANLTTKANSTIDLMGLNRIPGGVKPTEADTRWRSRQEIWDLAKLSFSNWQQAPIPAMANTIATASLIGHYSIWCKVFENEQVVLDEIDTIYRTKGLFKEFEPNGNRVIRPQGLI
jgi:5-methylcytosine-specific restriction endonuclease McrA